MGRKLCRLITFIESQGIALEFNERIAPANGISYGGKIVLLPGLSKAQTCATLVHELSHEMLHKAERRSFITKTVREIVGEANRFHRSQGQDLKPAALQQTTYLSTTATLSF